AGGVRTAFDALRMVAAGANRIGTSGGVAIMRELLEGRLHSGAAQPQGESY
ncbi:MAG: 2-deoxyribose-5-phosphate aldolase, partial [Candidatus Thermofonsia Clade 3 bacterium]